MGCQDASRADQRRAFADSILACPVVTLKRVVWTDSLAFAELGSNLPGGEAKGAGRTDRRVFADNGPDLPGGGHQGTDRADLRRLDDDRTAPT